MSKVRKARTPATIARAPQEPLLKRIETFLERHALTVTAVLILLASIRIVSTYTVFGQTSDEPAHLGCGIEWLDKHVYRCEPQHPPLTRTMVALGPYLDGARFIGKDDMFMEGNAILYAESGTLYERRLTLSRAGNLPFFWLACGVVFLWGRRLLNGAGAVLAVLIFTMIPTALAHAGLATTDMGITAWFAAAAYAL